MLYDNVVIVFRCVQSNADVCRRKRGERDITDTPGDVIVRKLTVERIEELKRIIQEEKAKYRSVHLVLEMPLLISANVQFILRTSVVCNSVAHVFLRLL